MAFNTTKKIGGANLTYHKIVDVRIMDLQDPVFDTNRQPTGDFNGLVQVRLASYKDKATRLADVKNHAPLITVKIPGIPTGAIDFKEWVYTELASQVGGEFEGATRAD